jgi:hypothetical protein
VGFLDQLRRLRAETGAGADLDRSGPSPPTAATSSQAAGGASPEALVREEAVRLIEPGFRTHAEALAELVEIVEDDVDFFGDSLTSSEVAPIVDQVWSERLSIQGGWSDLSDADRLDSAFAELEASGIVARMNFTCCGTCGAAEIGGEVAEGLSPRGYVFFHMQDADGLVGDEASELFLGYGAWTPDGSAFADEAAYAVAATAIGREIVRTLEAAGLRVSWDGNLARRICVVDLDWRRRLPV